MACAQTFIDSYSSKYRFDPIPNAGGGDFTFLNAEDAFYRNSNSLLTLPNKTVWLLYDSEVAETYTLKRIIETALMANICIQLTDVNQFQVIFGNKFANGSCLMYKGDKIEQFPDYILCRLGASRCNPTSMAVLRALESHCSVLNTADAIERAANKLATARCLAAHGVATPTTMMLLPHNTTCQKLVNSQLGFPVVVKAAVGSKGDGVMLIKDAQRLGELCGLLSVHNHYLAQEFVAASAGSDTRVWVVKGRCVAAMRRQAGANAGIRANIHQGGSAFNVPLTPQLTKVASGAAQALGLTMAGVDLLENKDGTFVVCEVNAAAGIEAFEKATSVDVAKQLVSLIV